MQLVARVEDDEEFTLLDPSVTVSDDAFRTWPEYPTLNLVGTLPQATRYWRKGERLRAYVFVDPDRFRAGETVPIDGAQAMAWVYRQPGRPDNLFPALLWDGDVRLRAAGTQRGATVAGSVESTIWMWRARLEDGS